MTEEAPLSELDKKNAIILKLVEIANARALKMRPTIFTGERKPGITYEEMEQLFDRAFPPQSRPNMITARTKAIDALHAKLSEVQSPNFSNLKLEKLMHDSIRSLIDEKAISIFRENHALDPEVDDIPHTHRPARSRNIVNANRGQRHVKRSPRGC